MSQQRRTQYFDAAFALLTQSGYAALKQAALCERLGVTTGAFYHSFASWADFTTQFLEHWRTERTTRLVEVALSETGGSDQLDALLHASLSLPHEAEAAIRVWSTIDPDVARVQADVDAARFDVVLKALSTMVDDVDKARDHARIAMMLLIGFEQSGGDKDPALLAQALLLIREHATTPV